MHGIRRNVPLDGLVAAIAIRKGPARGASAPAAVVPRRTVPKLMPTAVAKRASESATEMVEVVLPDDANPLGFMQGGNVMRLIDFAGAIAAIRHARSPMVTAAVDGLQFLNPIKVGDFVVLKAHVTATFNTSLEVEVLVYAESALTGERQMTSRAHV